MNARHSQSSASCQFGPLFLLLFPDSRWCFLVDIRKGKKGKKEEKFSNRNNVFACCSLAGCWLHFPALASWRPVKSLSRSLRRRLAIDPSYHRLNINLFIYFNVTLRRLHFYRFRHSQNSQPKRRRKNNNNTMHLSVHTAMPIWQNISRRRDLLTSYPHLICYCNSNENVGGLDESSRRESHLEIWWCEHVPLRASLMATTSTNTRRRWRWYWQAWRARPKGPVGCWCPLKKKKKKRREKTRSPAACLPFSSFLIPHSRLVYSYIVVLQYTLHVMCCPLKPNGIISSRCRENNLSAFPMYLIIRATTCLNLSNPTATFLPLIWHH